MGQTWMQINGDTAIVPVVFADEGSAPLLGAVTLEIFLLAVDPVRHRLIPVRGLLKAKLLWDRRLFNYDSESRPKCRRGDSSLLSE